MLQDKDFVWTDEKVLQLIRQQPEFEKMGWNTQRDIIRSFKEKNISKQPLFITEDKQPIHYGDNFFAVNKYFKLLEYTCAGDWINYNKSEHILFATKEAAIEYILMNKPNLSLQEILPIYKHHLETENFGAHFWERLKELAKNKLDNDTKVQ